MATKVYYKQGTKAQYLALPVHLTNGLYFCTDTKELFKGDDLYSDGIRFAETFEKLPSFDSAADGILYVCRDTGSGFVLDAARDKWVPVLFAPDNETIIVNEKGLLEIKKIPTETIDGLDKKVKELIKEMGGTGGIKPNSEFDVGEDGTVTIKNVDSAKVTYRSEDLTDILDDIKKSLTWGDMGTAVDLSASTASEAVTAANDGDTISFSEGEVDAMTIKDKAVTLEGMNAGLKQNFKQEVSK